MTDHIIVHSPDRSLLRQVEGAEKLFLSGRRNREADPESAVRFFLEFLHGFESFDFQRPCVTVFGSARFAENHRYYRLAREVGASLARAGFAVMTGGGGGIMEAANRGAKDAGGLSLGCNITLPREQKPNRYLDKFIQFEHFPLIAVDAVRIIQESITGPGSTGPG
jgi:predicted Rossmann-fold nucleotide-binding protein